MSQPHPVARTVVRPVDRNARTWPPPPVDGPPCHCPTPTPWLRRKDDGPFIVDDEVIGYQRTCWTCGASKTAEPASEVAA